MIRRALKVASVELTSTVPPRLTISDSTSSREFKLHGSKTISELFSEMRAEVPSYSKLQITANDKCIPESTLLSDLTKQEFTLTINDSSIIYVLPGLAFFIRGHESYYKKCHDLGVPFNEARSIAKLLEHLDTKLPENFDPAALKSALKDSKAFFEAHTKEEAEILNFQKESFKRALKPLEEQLESIKAMAERHADRVLKLGLGVLVSQWAGIAYGTFVLYGWDVMEPFSYMVGSTWTVLGFSFFMRHRQEFYPSSFREILYNSKLEKLLKKYKFSLARVELLKKNIEMLENEIAQIE